MTLFYTLAVVALGFHLRHGCSARCAPSASAPRRRAARPALGAGAVVVLCAGFLSVPFAVLDRSGRHEPVRRRRPDRRHRGARTGRSRPAGSAGGSTASLVNPANRRKLTVIVVGTGLAGGSAAATLAEHGYRVRSYCYQDSPRRAHSIAAQGGINAAKNYRNDGDSVHRLFYDTVKGGDFRSRESNVHRLAQVSVEIIDQCVAQGVPFAREYGGLLDTRSFGGAQVSRTFYARGQTGQQLLLGAYQALERQIAAGTVEMHARHEMLDLIVVDGRARGIVVRDLVTGEITTDFADAVVLATGGYGNVFYLSTNAKGCNVTATWRAHRQGALFANPCFTQIHPTCIPVSGAHQSKLTLMSESLRNDGRVWVPPRAGDDRDRPATSPRTSATTTWSGSTRRSATSCRATSPPAPPRTSATRAAASAPAGWASTSTSPTRSRGWAGRRSRRSTATSSRCTSGSPARTRTRCRCGSIPAVHYTMGGLWVDYDLQSTDPRPVRDRRGQLLRPRRQPARRVRAHAGPRRRLLRAAQHDQRLPRRRPVPGGRRRPRLVAARTAVDRPAGRLLAVDGDRTVDSFHRELGRIMWDHCGMERTDAGLRKAIELIRALREEFWTRVKVPATADDLNQSLEKAGRVADFFELAELMCVDALHRTESCGGHFRAESQTAGRRGAARRRRASPTSPPGSSPARDRRCCTGRT